MFASSPIIVGAMAGRELPTLTSEGMTRIVLLDSGLVKETNPMSVCQLLHFF